jgi:hypothetical protein
MLAHSLSPIRSKDHHAQLFIVFEWEVFRPFHLVDHVDEVVECMEVFRHSTFHVLIVNGHFFIDMFVLGFVVWLIVCFLVGHESETQ